MNQVGFDDFTEQSVTETHTMIEQQMGRIPRLSTTNRVTETATDSGGVQTH